MTRHLHAFLLLSFLFACNSSTTGPADVQPVISWTTQTSGTTRNLHGAAWTGTHVVAVGDQGIILTSPDGVKWTAQNSGTTNNLYSVVWTGTQLVAVGLIGTILTSPDGVKWTMQDSRLVNNPVSTLFSIIWVPPTNSIGSQAGSGQLVVVGSHATIITSPDGVNWSVPQQFNLENNDLFSVVSTGSQLVAVGRGTIVTSSDEVNWSVASGIKATDTLNSITWTGTRLVAAGGNGTHTYPTLITPNATILTSLDGNSWNPQNSNNDNNPLAALTSAVWTGSELLAVGQNGTVLVSPDGVSWTALTSGTADLSCVIHAGQQWVAVGAGGVIQTAHVTDFNFGITQPGAPTGVTALAGNAQAIISWTAPASDGGSEITGYTVRAVQDTSKHCATTGLNCVITGLTDGTAYTFVVTATNAKGTSAASLPSPAATPAITPPGAPTAVTARPGNTQVAVSWTAPVSNGGSTITGYIAKAVQDTSKRCTTTGLNCVITGLADGTAYTFTVTATNTKGAGIASLPSPEVTPALPPGSPTGVKGTSDYLQAIVSWTPPASDGGSPVLQYTATSLQDTSRHCTTAGLSCAVTGLTNGTAYTFTVTATNAVGTSAASAPSLPVTPATFPGVTWTARNSGASNFLSGAVWAGSQWVVVGTAGTVLTSPDGATWTVRNSGTLTNLNSVTWTGPSSGSGTGQLAAVGDNGTVLTSPDGITWTVRNSGTTKVMSSVTWTGSLLVSVGGAVLTSPDGVTWTTRNSGTANSLNSVAWTGSLLVAVGYSGNITTSPDGINWTARTSNTSNILSSATSTGSELIIVGGSDTSGSVLTSPDGVNWTAGSSGTSYALSSVTWTGTHLVATGFYGNILTSPDGVNWTARNSGTTSQLNFVTWTPLGSQLIAVGAHGTLLTSH